ncbi:MAG: MMPL family transporter [Candidatus Obscuribacterales bacterium]|nr:MMPL family transporter [Steroidobacteraceae bacterium]
MGANSPVPTAVRVRFIGWSVLMLAVLAIFAFNVLPNLRIETDILALLPQTEADTEMSAALDTFAATLARKQIFLIAATDLDDAKKAAQAFATSLRASKAFARVDSELQGDAEQRFAIYIAARGYLLAPQDNAALRDGRVAGLEQQALRAAYTPTGLMQPIGLAQDPLALLNNFLREQTTTLGNARLDGSMLVIERDEHWHVIVVAESDGSPFASAVHERVIPAIDQATHAARNATESQIKLLSSGTLQHAAAATQQSKAEIATFGSIELIAVVLLLWSIFGTLRPLAIASLTLGLAATAAFTVVHFLFGTVHLLAVVFGSSLIGGVIDYSIHFFADRFRKPLHWQPVEALHHVGGAILLGLTTTLIGYVVLALMPFPGLKQIAVFCAVGLVVGAGSVLCLYPVFAQPGSKPPPPFGARVGAAIDRLMANWRWTRLRVISVAITITIILLGLTRAQVQDDIRALQQSPPELLEQEKQVRDLLGTGVETRFFLVTGTSEQAVLDTEQRLGRELDRLVAQGALNAYQAVSRSLPSLTQQQENHQMLAERVYAQDGLLDRVMRALGFPASAIESRREEFTRAAPLAPGAWLQSPASESSRHLWLGRIGTRHATVVTLGGINDVYALTTISLPDVRLIDRVTSTAAILKQYRRVISAMLAVIYVVAGAVLAIRFGWRDALRMLLPSATATALTLGLFGWFGVPINLFTLLALWLVLGLGIDYGIFLRHGQRGNDATGRQTAILSITLSACTTLLAFGLLAFSATPFIRSIGLTLLCAIMLSWLLVLFSCLTTLRKRSEPPLEVTHA